MRGRPYDLTDSRDSGNRGQRRENPYGTHCQMRVYRLKSKIRGPALWLKLLQII